MCLGERVESRPGTGFWLGLEGVLVSVEGREASEEADGKISVQKGCHMSFRRAEGTDFLPL